jgi:Anaphase-promoting complex, cyclosome, subunit 4
VSAPTPCVGRIAWMVVIVSLCAISTASAFGSGRTRPQYAVFDLPAEDVEDCLELAGRAIVISSWLAAVARRELFRFKEFICWLKYGN